MKSRKTIRLLIFPSLTFILSSCINVDYNLASISKEMVLKNEAIVMPIGSVDKTMEDILRKFDSDNLIVNGDMIYLNYKDTLVLTPDNKVSIKPPILSGDYQISAVAGRYPLNLKYVFTINSSNSLTRVDSARLVNARLKFLIRSGLSSSVNFRVVLPDGISLVDTTKAKFTVKPGVNTQYLDIKANSVLRLNNDGTNSFIKINYIVDVPASKSVSLSNVHVDFSFEKFNVDLLWGYFPDVSLDKKINNIHFNPLSNFLMEGNKLGFFNPEIKCMVQNYTGIPTNFNINYIKAYDKDGNSACADFSGSEQYSFAVKRAEKEFEPISTFRTFDRYNGGTNRLFSIEPTTFSYSFTTKTLAQPNDHHFIVADKYADVIIEMKLPLSFEKGIMMMTKDTFSMDISGLSNKVKVNDLIMYVDYANKLPLKSALKVIFIDENKSVISEIKEKSFDMESSALDAKGYAIDEVKGSFSIKFDEAEFSSIPRIKYVVLLGSISGSDRNALITINPHDYIHFNADLYVNGDISINKK